MTPRSRVTVVGAAPEAVDDPDLPHRNWLLHRAVIRACNSARLMHILRICGRLLPIPQTAAEQFDCDSDEHAELIDGLHGRDGDTARRVTEKHFRSMVQPVQPRPDLLAAH